MKIALIAHDKKKEEIIELAKQYKDVLANYELYATGTTGTLIMGETALPIHRMKSGPLGGDQQIGAMLANGELGLIIFLRDPLTAQPHEPDVSAPRRRHRQRVQRQPRDAAGGLRPLSGGQEAPLLRQSRGRLRQVNTKLSEHVSVVYKSQSKKGDKNL